ncbi:mannitol dehydrogenase family protein [Nitratireductor sp. GISD-1A_MAKvit]|uniref:mannitol dehydrogenase family protein n=1 Tax=Nitratireductor sp. GISD-1A_MAKvit TaxID=3234198 RepID=UPI003466F7AA
MLPRLNKALLAELPDGIARPAYDPAEVTTGIVHLGVGAFHRAHQAAYVDACLAEGDARWGIIGVSLRSSAMRDALAPQDWLYTLAERQGDGERLKVLGPLREVLVAPEDPRAVLEAMAKPEIRLVTLTVTEKAYPRTPEGALDTSDPTVAADLADPASPSGILGFISQALALRRAAGTAPFTVLSCDNLPANGSTLRRLVVEFSRLCDPALARHIQEDVAFPSSMVDRIVPATAETDRERISRTLGAEDAWPVVTEPFMQWVVEDDFPQGRPDWERHGVEMVSDVEPFEEMKLRLLNGAHSAIAYSGQLLGHETVADAFADPLVDRFVKGLWREAAETLSGAARLEAGSYTERLSARFANPALRHRTAQIANDGSQKLPQRFVSPLLARLEEGSSAPHLCAGIALWIAALEARGSQPAFSDPLDERLSAIFDETDAAEPTAEAILQLAGFRSFKDYLPAVASAFQRIRNEGVTAELTRYP